RTFQFSRPAGTPAPMLQRLTAILAAATALAAALPAAAEPQAPAGQVRPVAHVELTNMMGRWYEVARFPNQIQRGCQAGASEWTRTADGFAVVQSCHKGTPDGPL